MKSIWLSILAALAVLAPWANAQKGQAKPTASKPVATAPAGASHPGAQAAVDYLRAIHLHDWDKAVKLVEQKSLTNLQSFQYEYLRQAPTMKDEEVLLSVLKLKNIDEVKTLKADEIFLRRGRAKTNKLADKEGYLKQIRATLSLKALGTVVENDGLVHVVVRKEFSYKEKHVSELAFVSAVKEGAAWRVSLDAQEPEVTEVGGAKKNGP